MRDREEEIKKAVKEITGVSPKPDIEATGDESIRAFSVKNVLIIAPSFDYFLFEEEGRLEKLFEEIFGKRDFSAVPNITHVEKGEMGLETLKDMDIDLIIVFNKPVDMDILNLTREVEEDHPEIPVVLIGNDTSEIENVLIEDETGTIGEAFTWYGDGRIILSIVQYIEDKRNLENGVLSENGKGILVIEDSIQFYSKFLPLIYDEIWMYLDAVIEEDLPRGIKSKRYWNRPYVLLASDIEEGKVLYRGHKENLICLVTDNHCSGKEEQDKQVGVNFALEVEEEKSDISIMVQSSEPIKELPESSDIEFILKDSPTLTSKISEFVRRNIGPLEVVIENEYGAELSVIKSFEDLEKAVLNIDENILKKYLEKGEIPRWLKARAEEKLAEEIEAVLENWDDAGDIKNEVARVLEDHRYSSHRGSISNFERKGEDHPAKISRIGKGALGGKARGIAFMAKILSRYVTDEMFEGLHITVPRSVVLSTDIYEKFIQKNDLVTDYIENTSDERISSKFIDRALPATVIGDLRSFVRKTRTPLIVRSSGVLEDSMMQPFAGIYSSVLLPNDSWETDLRFKEVCNAIKHVYASTFFEKARTYLKSTPKKLGDEKMAVMLQEVIGEKHGKYFYPTISGVAKSYNHYPSGPCKAEDGIVYLALGLGKAVVDGSNTFCFCPEHPKAPLSGTPKDFMRYSQNDFYAVDLESVYKRIKKDEETSLVKLSLDKAKEHGVLEKVVSTYSPRNDRLYPGTNHEGPMIVDFGPIVKYNAIPLAKAFKMLLKVSEIALGYPVEIEFAVNLNEGKDEPAELVILQIRSMMSKDMFLDVDLDECKEENLVCSSQNALGYGVMKGIKDVVYIKPDEFDMKNTQRAVEQLRELNKKLMSNDRPYILIGPGRWGSSDEWLGIPVLWSDIAGAKVIVETPTEGRRIDPSQGSHFFHDMISSQAGYLITGPGSVDWGWLDSQEVEDEKMDVKHVKTDQSLDVMIDGKVGKGVIVKKSKKDVNED
ncbi:MAG: PEP/pyruvate-binding domain-containing protein [Candidatus Saliniplasma sp.]